MVKKCDCKGLSLPGVLHTAQWVEMMVTVKESSACSQMSTAVTKMMGFKISVFLTSSCTNCFRMY